MANKFLGLGPNAVGLTLAGIFFGTYFTSVYLTRKHILQTVENPVRPRYFRDVRIMNRSEEED
eukprot:4316453-Pleurochrysis_carterae.AAC.3